MLKVLKYLKNSFASVIVIILLLCVQAATDLKLPDYTSKIVNIGIQQGGIENVSPEAISKKSMDNMLIFTENDEKILENYTLIDKENLSEKEYKKYQKKYPNIEKEEIYVLNKIKGNKQEELNSIMAKPLMELQVVQNEEIAGKIKEQLLLNVPNAQKQMIANMDLMRNNK